MTISEKAVEAAVDQALKDGLFPIYETQDDNGLERDEYVKFVSTVLSFLPPLTLHDGETKRVPTDDEVRVEEIIQRVRGIAGATSDPNVRLITNRDFDTLLASRLAWKFTAKCFAAGADDWRPIKTAPLGDDDFYLVCAVGDDRSPFVVRGSIFASARKHPVEHYLSMAYLTHWMPLPEKPQHIADQEGEKSCR